MSELLQGLMFPDDADASTSSLGASPARTSLPPGRATDSTVIARRSSLRSPDLLARSDQLGSSLRTSLRSAAEGLTGYSLNWTDSGTPGGRAWWVLGRSGRRTSGTGCGSSDDGWPTPNAQAERDHPDKTYSTTNNAAYSDGRKCQPTLMGVLNRLNQWTSPTCRDAESLAKVTRGAGSLAKGNQLMPPLAVQASWPTPQNYAKGDEKNHEPGLTPLDLAVRPEMPAAIQERIRKGQRAWPSPDARDAHPEGLECGKRRLEKWGTQGLQTAATLNQWPTPRSEDSEQTGAHAGVTDTLTSKARQDWFTPQGRDWKDTGPSQGNRKDVNLGVQAHRCAGPPAPARRSTSGKRRDWCTPVMPAGGRTNRNETRQDEPLFQGQIREETTGDRHHSGQLNPAWVTQLQGLPDGWLDLPEETLSRLSATRTRRTSRTSSGGGL